MDRVVKPKTRRGKRALESKEPKLVEGEKNAVFVRGSNVNQTVTQLMKDLVQLKKPYSTLLNKKNDIKPFENAVPLEFMALKNESPLFLLGSHSKKRPNNVVIGRTYDQHVLDMFELGIEDFQALSSFKVPKIFLGCKPIISFHGEAFENEAEYVKLKSLLLDFFCGAKTDAIRLPGLEHLISITAAEGKIYFRSYRILLKKSGTKLPRVEIEEMGPRFNAKIRRHQLASDALTKLAEKQPKQLKPRKIKNINRSGLGTLYGRVHMNRQDYGQLQTRKLKGLKGAKRSRQEAGEDKRSNKRIKFNVTENPQ